ncbi:MAG: 23S ribosomal RNA methyltransferase Erm [Mycobacterium sp.]|nr:23S ribosomal RNA methyltransferase Erm [Mycobacterium sp.]
MRAPNARRRASGGTARGQHLLRSDSIAAELVEQAGIGLGEVVLEIGAGLGRLTAPLSRCADHVIAVELDDRFARRLHARFGPRTTVEVVTGDILQIALPTSPFRVVGNVPFGVTTAVLRRLLDDPDVPLTGVDVLVEWNVARKRAATRPSTLVSLGWQPWWDFRLVRHLQASAFEPRPSVDAGFLAIRRRDGPLVSPDQRPAYRALVARAFRKANLPVERSLAATLPPRVVRACLHDRALPLNARATELDVFDWTALFAAVQAAGGQKSSNAIPSGSRKLKPEP